jgi:glycosyltransferase involved in cell wall biosynthesis
VSPGLSSAYERAGLDRRRLRQVCNAVDVDRFRPSSTDERRAIRASLGLPQTAIVLFVGFFSRDKRPYLAYRAWARIARSTPSVLVFAGATAKTYLEVDPDLIETIRGAAAADGLADRIVFAGVTPRVDEYFRAADVYILTSIREGLSRSLLEAMSSGLSVVATRLPGSTDGMIRHEVNGLLVAPDDEDGFARALERVLTDRDARCRLGASARQTVVDRYSIRETAGAWLAGYRELLSA